MAQLWNRSPGSWNAFPKFLDLVYSNRVGREERAVETTADDEPVTLPFRQPSELVPLRVAA
jgi:hypothetical protein